MCVSANAQAAREKIAGRLLLLDDGFKDDLPLVFLYFADALPVVASRIHGVDPGPNGVRWQSFKWFVPRPLQRYTAG